MRMISAVLLLIVMGVAGCAPVWPHPIPFVSPLAVRQQTYYLPLLTAPGNKLGMTGGSCEMARALGASWFYTWAPVADAGCAEGVPMIWGDSETLPAIAGKSAWLLGPNECDRWDQCNLSATATAQLTRRIVLAYPGKRHVATVPSSGNAAYLVRVRDEYIRLYGEPPPWSALALHCYMPAQDCIWQIRLFVNMARQWGIGEVWLTEFAYTPEMDPHWREQIAELLAYAETEPLLTRVSPYVSRQNCSDGTWNCVLSGDPSLFEWDHQTLTEIGRRYQRSDIQWIEAVTPW